MKKLFIAALFGIFVTCCYGQDVKVNINNNDVTTKDDCAFRINGICSSEDIGGVDLEFVTETLQYCSNIYANLTNYNSFPVSVIFKVKELCNTCYKEKTFTVVLGVNGIKRVTLFECYQHDVSLEGMIVRKLAQ